MIGCVGQTLRKFLRNNRGATAIEFAMVAGPLFAGFFATIEVSYKFLLQTELDNKLYNVSVDIGINNHSATDAAEFMRDHFCPNIGTNFMKCDEVEIGIRNVTGATRLVNMRNESIIGEWDMGVANDAIVIELNYPMRDIVHPIAIGDIIERDGERYYRARAVTRREPLLSSGP